MKTKQLQKNWRKVKLENGEYFEIIMGQSPPGDSYNENKDGVPFFQGKAEFTERYPIIKKWTTQPSKLSEPRSILMSVRAPVGDVNINNIKSCIGRGLASIKPLKEIELYYLFYFLKIIKNKISNMGAGSTFKAITSSQLKSIKIPLPFTPDGKPDLETQKKIVAILEKAEQLKERRKKSVEVLDEYLKSVFSEMFLKKKFGEVELNNKGLFEIQSGGTPRRDKKEYWENGTIPWIGSTACKDLPIDKAEQFITEEGLKNSSAKLLSKNTILVALVGATIGKTGILKFECATNQNIAGISIKDKKKIEEIYLFYMLQNLYSNFLSLSSASFKMANLSFVRSLKIPLPPLPLQKKFASIVEHVEKLKEKQKKSLEEIEDLFNALMQKAFKGELV